MAKMSSEKADGGDIRHDARKSTSKLLEDTLKRTNQTLSFLQARYQSSGRPEHTQQESKEPKDLHAAEARALGDAEAMKTHAAKHPDNTDRSRLNADRSRSGSRDETQIATSGTTGTGGSGTGGSVSGVSGVSESLKSSHWTRQCEGYGSQASRSTEDIKKEHSVDSALDEDLAEELMSVTFAKPFQKTRFHSTSEESTDGPGQYVVIKDTGFASETADFPGSQDGMAYIRAGAIVEVVEVGGQKPDRLQGRILSPPGWISLLDTESGYRWACKVEVGGEHVESKAPSTPRASLVVLPASHDKISTVCRKPRPKAIHRRAWPKDVNAPFQLARNAQPTGEFKA
ncbi:unnamed protein product [Cladocopium goreaui]|uniref:Uncharacterized protein n=1 Tax=Cladocopium goreaui TaxID=2562237 RepID=A0A9P1BKF5_9DINO|nr:unnamed protein product [Cladocopium goreaui]